MWEQMFAVMWSVANIRACTKHFLKRFLSTLQASDVSAVWSCQVCLEVIYQRAIKHKKPIDIKLISNICLVSFSSSICLQADFICKVKFFIFFFFFLYKLQSCLYLQHLHRGALTHLLSPFIQYCFLHISGVSSCLLFSSLAMILLSVSV